MSTSTTNFGLIKPDVGSVPEQDLWGTYTNTDWDSVDVVLKTSLNMVKSSKSASFSVTAPTSGSTTTGDSNKFFLCDATAGAIIVSLPTAATAGDGFKVAFKKTDASANTVTIIPNGTEKVDGASTFVISTRYDSVFIVCDGTGWNILSNVVTTAATTYVKTVKKQVFTSNGTYTPNTGMLYAIVELVGGGGGGGTPSTQTGGGGGGAGGYSRKLVTASDIGASKAVTIGSGGAAGGDGGTTSLGAIFSASGGLAGSGTATAGTIMPGGAGGSGSGGDFNGVGMPGGYGFLGYNAGAIWSGAGGSTFLGGGAGSKVAASNVGGDNGATNTGGGGSGGIYFSGSSSGGTGGSGVVIITEYCSA